MTPAQALARVLEHRLATGIQQPLELLTVAILGIICNVNFTFTRAPMLHTH